MMQAAVVGVGYLGTFHAEKYAALSGVALAAVIDIDPERARGAAARFGCRAYTDHRDLPAGLDVASVVVPTCDHHVVARDLLQAGLHVLAEKPIAATVGEARELVAFAEAGNRVLQVGHLERYNPVVRALAGHAGKPLFIESYRISRFRPRGTDVNVVLDLMIHDIELIGHIVSAPIERIEASGAPVLTAQIDIANARLRFAGGCVANVTASRVGLKTERRMRVFQRNAYLSADLARQTLEIRRRTDSEMYPGVPGIEEERMTAPAHDALMDEIRDFTASVRDGAPPLVSGADGLRALEAAVEITRQLEARPPPGASERLVAGGAKGERRCR